MSGVTNDFSDIPDIIYRANNCCKNKLFLSKPLRI